MGADGEKDHVLSDGGVMEGILEKVVNPNMSYTDREKGLLLPEL